MNSPSLPTPDVTLILVLPNGREIRRDLLDRVRASIPALDWNRDYSLKEICGRDFWRSLPKAHRIRGGSTIAHLVKTGKLPLAFATCPHAVPKKYRRI